MTIIECKKLTKKYVGKKVLNELSFSIEKNKITGLIGRNGVGKTTLLKIMAGFIKETSGELKVFSEKPYNSLFVSQNTVLVDDEMNFPNALQLYELLEIGGKFYPNWDAELSKRLFDYFAFNRFHYHHRLSKGKRSTFNAIFGLAARAPLTIFDEPTTGMDAAVRKDFYRALLKDYLAYPRTIIISSHHLDEIEDLLEDVLLLKNGENHLHMPLETLKSWAIGISGPAVMVQDWTDGKQVVYENHIGINTVYAVVKNEYSENELFKAKLAGLEITAVRPSDLCVYLTGEMKGGIDDVFKDCSSTTNH